MDYVIELQEPAFSENMLLRWLNQVEAEIQTEVLLLAVDGIVQYSADDMDAELIVPAPFSKLYEDYLNWRIALGQGEAERANNLETIYHESYLAYVRFVCDTISPGSGCAEQLRYYLTAYQIAVKYGYNGTEEEWVKSLKGANGEPGAGLRIVAQVASEAALPNLENTEEDIGKGYLVGYGTSALLYIWDGRNWFYKTQLSGKGEKGDPGEHGEPGKNGADGVGIRSIAFKSYTASGNVYTVTLTNDKTYDFIAPPGPAGPIGPTGETGSGIDVEYDETTGTVSIVNGEGTGEGGAGADGVGIHSIAFKAAADDGNIYTVTLTNGDTYDIIAPKGPAGENGSDGADGEDGSDGVSPVVSVEEITGGHRVTITDAEGTKTFDVMDGKDGADGDGTDRLEVTFTYVINNSTCSHTYEEIKEAYDAGRDVVAYVKNYAALYETLTLDLKMINSNFAYFWAMDYQGINGIQAHVSRGNGKRGYINSSAFLKSTDVVNDPTKTGDYDAASATALNQVYQIANAAMPETETTGSANLVDVDGGASTLELSWRKVGRFVMVAMHVTAIDVSSTNVSFSMPDGFPEPATVATRPFAPDCLFGLVETGSVVVNGTIVKSHTFLRVSMYAKMIEFFVGQTGIESFSVSGTMMYIAKE